MGVSWDKLRASDKPTSFFIWENMAEENKVQIFINEKEILYSHQNIVAAINSFLPYLTNDDLDEMMKTFTTLKEHRRQKEYLALLEAREKSIQKNRHDT